MYLSTGMRTELDPMSSTPVEMTLPFTHYKNWMDVSVPETLGSLYLRELVPLTRASNTAVSSIAITAFVWMEGAELCVPTLAAPTSQKEQPAGGAVSGIASAVASAAGKMASVPFIGKYAKATSIASGAASDVAKLFGLSRPVDIVKPMQNKFVTSGSFALTQGDSLAQKLTLDPRQEVTLDPTTVGLGPQDEMTFESIVNRESWLTTVIWSDAGGPFTVSGASTVANIGQLLFVANVTPNLCKRLAVYVASAVGNVQIAQPTPSMFIARAFNFWRGTMVYRFRVVASSFHRGNLRVTYDPISPVQALDTNSQMTHVLDISEGRELIVRVPWCSQYPYLEVASQLHEPLENYSPSLHTAYTNFAYTNYNKGYHNGVVMASIVNQLVAPNDQPAYIVVSSWMEDCEFQSPSRRIELDHPLMVVPTSGSDPLEITLVSGTQSTSMSQVCFGERVTSIRSMMKRSVRQYVLYNFSTGSATTPIILSCVLPQFPLYGATNLIENSRANTVTFLTYFASAFAMRRGGVRYNIVWDDNLTTAAVSETIRPVNASYTRSWDVVSPGAAGAINPAFTLDVVGHEALTSFRKYFAKRLGPGYEGMYVANFKTQERIHEIEVPYYGGTRFSLAQYAPVPTMVGADPSTWTLTKNPSESGFQLWIGQICGGGTTTWAPIIYSSAAEDMSFFWFQSPAPLYIVVGT